jgi:medium-chain acyl-[acyl-carrier-protein] hydrolase
MTADTEWLIFNQARNRARLRLYCLPHAGGGAAAYAAWANLLPPDVELCRIQLPGRENRLREAPFVAIAPLVEELAAVLRPHLDLPFALFGHSMGALIAFELARQLRRDCGVTSTQLFVSGRWAPHWPSPDPALAQLPDAEFIAALRARYNNIPDIVANDPELLAIYVPLLRADITLLDTYVYTPDRALDCPIVALGGVDDERVPYAALVAWQEHSTQSVLVRQFPGGHFYLQTVRSALLTVLAQELARPPHSGDYSLSTRLP